MLMNKMKMLKNPLNFWHTKKLKKVSGVQKTSVFKDAKNSFLFFSNKKMKKKVMEKALIIVLIAFALILFLYNFNFLIEPKQNSHTTSRIVVFRWIGNSNAILIDDNSEFTSPVVLKGNKITITELEPGNYFWKAEGFGSARKFTIDSAVVVDYKQNENNTAVKNSGNVNLFLELFNNLALTGNAILNLNQEINVSNADEIVASQK